MQDLATTFMSMAIAVIISIKDYFHMDYQKSIFILFLKQLVINTMVGEVSLNICIAAILKWLFLYSSNLKVDSLSSSFHFCLHLILCNTFVLLYLRKALFTAAALYQKLEQTLITWLDWMCGQWNQSWNHWKWNAGSLWYK